MIGHEPYGRARDVTSQVFLLGTNAENDPIAGKTSDMAGYADDGTLRRKPCLWLARKAIDPAGPVGAGKRKTIREERNSVRRCGFCFATP
jgi:hypothetical protein